MISLGGILLLALAPYQASGQQTIDSSGSLSSAEINRIVTTFTKKEVEFRQALSKYTFKRDALVQSVGMGGQITGEYRRVSTFLFDEQGNRGEKIRFAPFATFAGVTPEDIDDLGGVNPFALEPSKIDRYSFKYVGKEKIDELSLYVFDVAPKVIPDPKTKERLFLGRIWVDDQQLQIVKSRGKGVPETKINKFPNVETYRQEIDGKYWFPTYSYADEELVFDSGEVLHIRMKVLYSEFVLPHTKVIITEADGPEPAATPTPGVTSPQPSNTVQRTDPQQPIESGVLNPKAIELPEAKLPAGSPNISGKVVVRVVIDETGKVISAEVEEGRIELRLSAVEAARKARFPPMLLEGKPVKITGVITYRFYP
jgi:TonB family protein